MGGGGSAGDAFQFRPPGALLVVKVRSAEHGRTAGGDRAAVRAAEYAGVRSVRSFLQSSVLTRRWNQYFQCVCV